MDLEKIIEEFVTPIENWLNVHHTLPWDEVSKYSGLSEKFIRLFKDELNWDLITEYQTLSEEFIIEFEDRIVWNILSYKYEIGKCSFSKEFLEKFKNKL